MAPAVTGRTRPTKTKGESRPLKRKRNEQDVSTLNEAVASLDPKDEIDSFIALPLSRQTAAGLEASHFKTLTDIQAKAIPLGLKGLDILGAAKTGSGKTLSFLVPVLENLLRKRWTEFDGLGALIMSPTRELAIQIFEVLRKIGRHHTFSAGLVIGGKSLQEERERLSRMNILVCTPGRMLQHMDQTAMFEIEGLQMLVLDEADRILDMGFQKTVDAIVEHLPRERQTMLFSATQTKKVSDLARLSLRDPQYVAVHETAASATPSTLQQSYIVTLLPDKLNTLYSFLRSNLKSKTLVFLSSGKQVRFVYESFRRLQPGVPLLHLHGRQKQTARLDITTRFSAAKYSCLFATDVAARGLDFPAVDWVLQVDCPEDADTYIHRVGRTARYERDGKAVLFVDPHEEKGMLKRLAQKKVTPEKINVRQKKQQSIKNQLQNMCFKEPELKYLGQKAFISYARSVHMQKDKEIFDINALPLEEYSASLGLPGAPRIKFTKGDDAKKLKNAPRQLLLLSDGGDSDASDASGLEKPKGKSKGEVRTKYDRMFERQNQDVLSSHYSKLIEEEDEEREKGRRNPQEPGSSPDEDDDDGFLAVKSRGYPSALAGEHGNGEASDPSDDDHDSSKKKIDVHGGDPLIVDSKRREKLLKSKKKLLKLKGKGSKLVYDDEGNAHPVYELEDENNFRAGGDVSGQRARFLEEERRRANNADLTDKRVAKDKQREKRELRKIRERAVREAEEEDDREDRGGVHVQLGLADENLDDAASAPEIQPPSKRAKKWFEKDPDANAGKEKGRGGDESFEDLEALATGLLDS